jgi:hypothetical protein
MSDQLTQNVNDEKRQYFLNKCRTYTFLHKSEEDNEGRITKEEFEFDEELYKLHYENILGIFLHPKSFTDEKVTDIIQLLTLYNDIIYRVIKGPSVYSHSLIHADESDKYHITHHKFLATILRKWRDVGFYYDNINQKLIYDTSFLQNIHQHISSLLEFYKFYPNQTITANTEIVTSSSSAVETSSKKKTKKPKVKRMLID